MKQDQTNSDPIPGGLFETNPTANLLPYEGEVNYFGPILTLEQTGIFFQNLIEHVVWRRDEVKLYGKKIVTAREVAWMGDEEFAYRYSGTTKVAQPWIPEMRELKCTIEEKVGVCFNSCLLNRYHSGEEGMSWHSDDERSLGPEPVIASMSLGAERRFLFRHKQTGQRVEWRLENGSLLVMRGVTQKCWQHSLPKTKRVFGERINLTFRVFADK